MSMIVLGLVLIAGAALLAGRSVLTVRTTGTPIGASIRAGDFIATPISRLEPYVPSLDRNAGRDRYSVGLLLHSVRDEAFRRYVGVAEGRTGSDAAKSKIDAVVGDLVYFDAPETVIVDARNGRVLSEMEARAAPSPPRPKGAEALAALSSPENRLQSLLAEAGEAGAPRSIDVGEGVDNLGFLRAAAHGPLLSLGDGDVLALYWTKPYRAGALSVARIAPSGAVRWRTQTEIGALDEALPDASRLALIGARPRVEGKVPEPLLVVIDTQTGRAAARSLLVE